MKEKNTTILKTWYRYIIKIRYTYYRNGYKYLARYIYIYIDTWIYKSDRET